MKYWKSHRTETPTISFFWRQWDTSDLNANISKLTTPLNHGVIQKNPDNNSHYVQHTNQCSQPQEPWVSFEQHALNFVEFTAGTCPLWLCSLFETVSHRCEHLKFKIGHRLERDLKWQGRRRFVDLNIMRSEVPKLIGKNYWSVETFRASVVAFVRNKMDVCDELSKIVRGEDIPNSRSKIGGCKVEYVRRVASETNAKVTFCQSWSGSQ